MAFFRVEPYGTHSVIDLTAISTDRWEINNGNPSAFTNPPFYFHLSAAQNTSVITKEAFKIGSYANLEFRGEAYGANTSQRLRVQIVNASSQTIDKQLELNIYASSSSTIVIQNIIDTSDLNPTADYKIQVYITGNNANAWVRFDTFKINSASQKTVPSPTPLYFVRNGKVISGLETGSNLKLTELSGTDGDYVEVNTIPTGHGSARFEQAIDGHKYSTLHITFKTTDTRTNLNRIGVTIDNTSTQVLDTIPLNASTTKITQAWGLTDAVNNYLGIHIYRSDATALVYIYEAYVD